MLNTFFLLHRLTYRVLCQKKLWKTSFFRKRLRIDQETLQISVFASVFLSLVKKTCCKEDTFLLLYCPMCRALYEREFEPPNSQSMSKEKSRNIANIGIQSYITKFSQKCFILSVYYTVLHWARLRKNYETFQISIFGLIILNLVKKNCFILPFYCNVLYTGCPKDT